MIQFPPISSAGNLRVAISTRTRCGETFRRLAASSVPIRCALATADNYSVRAMFSHITILVYPLRNRNSFTQLIVSRFQTCDHRFPAEIVCGGRRTPMLE
jgi:hypothetical protein